MQQNICFEEVRHKGTMVGHNGAAAAVIEFDGDQFAVDMDQRRILQRFDGEGAQRLAFAYTAGYDEKATA